MKTNLLFGLIALVLSTASAHATSTESRRLELFEFNFECRFFDDRLTTNTADSNSRFEGCAAEAQVFAWVDRDDRDDLMSNTQTRNFVRNKLAVRCGNHLIYADSAFLDIERRFVSIRGINGFPAIFIKRNRHDDVSSLNDNHFRSFLTFGERRIPGFCEVRNRPVHPRSSSDTLN
jgi:hypothetical protein